MKGTGTVEEHQNPEFQRGQIAALFVIVAVAGCMGSVRRFGDQLSQMRRVAEQDAKRSRSTAYWAGYLNAINRVERDLPYGEPEAVVKGEA